MATHAVHPFAPAVAPRDPALRALSQVAVERVTDAGGQQAVTLRNAPAPPVAVRLNGVTLDADAWSLSGRTLTLWPDRTRTLASEDVVEVHSHFTNR